MSVDWKKEFNAAITVCDKNGIILDMNDKAAMTFMNDGGKDLIGKNLFDCHSPASVDIIKRLLTEGKSNTYTIEKNGKKKLIYQAPWFNNNEVQGLVEISIELPQDMPHFVRS